MDRIFLFFCQDKVTQHAVDYGTAAARGRPGPPLRNPCGPKWPPTLRVPDVWEGHGHCRQDRLAIHTQPAARRDREWVDLLMYEAVSPMTHPFIEDPGRWTGGPGQQVLEQAQPRGRAEIQIHDHDVVQAHQDLLHQHPPQRYLH